MRVYEVMRGDAETNVVTDRKIKMYYLCFIYTFVFALSLVSESTSEVMEATSPIFLT